MSVRLVPLPTDRFDAWRTSTRGRLIELRQNSGMLVGEDAVVHADAFLDELIADGAMAERSRIFTIEDGPVELGTVWLAASDAKLFVVDLALAAAPSARQREGLFAALRGVAEQQQIPRISIGLYHGDAEGHALIRDRGFTLASIQMILEPLPRRDVASWIDVVPMTSERYPSFAAGSEAAFAEDLVASGRYARADALAESHRQMMLELPDGAATTGQKLFTAHVDGAEVGILWIGMRVRADRPHAFILDIEIAPEQRGKGYGREVMHAAEREARRFGADSVGLHVFGFNTGAIALYEKLGYRRVEESYFLDL